MKVVIVGAGDVGSYLSQLLSDEAHAVTIIESDPATAQRVDEAFDVRVLQGNGSSASVLQAAGAGDADFFLALTSDDRANLLASSLAKALGAQTTIARIHDQTYADSSFLNYQEHFGIDTLINPEALCAVELAKAIRHAGRVVVENFARGHIEVQQIALSGHSSLRGKALKDLRLAARIGYLQRAERIEVPTALTVLEEGDLLTVFGTPEAVYALRNRCEGGSPQIRRVVLLGGGETAIALIRLLSHPRFRIRVIENDSLQSRVLAEKFPNVTVIQGDGTSLRLMEEEQIGSADYFVACTRNDENNIVTALQASRLGAGHVGVVINKTDYDEALDLLKTTIGVELIVSPRKATANEILRYLSRKPYTEMAALPGGGGRIYEIVLRAGSTADNCQLSEIDWPRPTVVVALQHKYKIHLPTATDVLHAGDRLLLISHPENLNKILRLLRG